MSWIVITESKNNVDFDSEPNQKHDTNFHNITLRKQLDTHLLHTKIGITKRKFMVWKKARAVPLQSATPNDDYFFFYHICLAYFILQNNNPEHTQLKRKICRETFYGEPLPPKKNLNWDTSSFIPTNWPRPNNIN